MSNQRDELCAYARLTKLMCPLSQLTWAHRNDKSLSCLNDEKILTIEYQANISKDDENKISMKGTILLDVAREESANYDGNFLIFMS